jgi:hypothetical protein
MEQLLLRMLQLLDLDIKPYIHTYPLNLHKFCTFARYPVGEVMKGEIH